MRGFRGRVAAALAGSAFALVSASCSSPGNGDISVRRQALGGDTIVATSAGSTTYVAQPSNPAVVVDPTIVINANAMLTTIDGASVSITTGLDPQDRLLFTNQLGITGSYSTVTGILTLAGTTSPANYQTALRTVQYRNLAGSSANTDPRVITFTVGSGLYLAATGHYYQFVTSSGITWEAAKTAAAASRYFDLQGYLVTVGSSAENSFVASKLTGQGWMGAMAIDPMNVMNPTNSNGVFSIPRTWYWVTGPEAGTAFYVNSNPCGLPNGTAVSGAYNNWSSSMFAAEPNDVPYCTPGVGTEAWAHFLLGGTWNDYAYNNPGIQGYVVEYGGMPGDPTPTLSGTKALQVEVVALSVSSNPSVAGQSITVTAAVGPSAATGTIQFAIDNANLSTPVALSGGAASFTASFLSVGTHQITASYSGDSTYAMASGVLSQVVDQASTSTALISAPNPSAFSQSTTLTATVTATAPGTGTATGLVTFKDGSTTIGTGTLSGGVATFATSALTTGAHSLTAVYAGDTSFNGSTSAPLAHSVGTTTTGTTVVSSNAFSLYGQAVTFTATIAPSSATGTVQFAIDGTNLGAGITVTAGSSTSPSIASLTAGPHTVTATYSGDGNTMPSSGMTTQTVSQSATTTTVASTPNPSALGQPATVTATVVSGSGLAVSGVVTFSRGVTVVGMGMINPTTGQASITTSSFPLGANSLTAAYSGDANDLASTSSAITHTVSTATTTTMLVSTPNPANQGQLVTLTATVTVNPPGSGTPTGTVTFFDGSTPIGMGVLAGGVAVFTSSSLSTGGHTLSASYATDGTYGGSTSTTLSQAVGKVATTTTVASSSSFSSYGQSVTFTATVTGTNATGAVTFAVDGTGLGTAMLAAGTATSPAISSLTVGLHTVTATYAGDTNLIGSSGMTAQTVGKSATTTILVATPNPAAVGQAVTLTTTTTAAGGKPVSGMISFSNGSTALGSATIDSGTGLASLMVSSLPAGSSTLSASYAGDANNLASAAAPVTEAVGKSATTTVLTVDHNPVNAGQTVTFTATVTAGAGGGTPTGTISFLDGAGLLGAGTLSAGGVATLAVTTLAAGDHSIVATYAGDSTRVASTSAPLVETVQPACTIAGQSYAPNALNPANPCQVCNPTAAQTAWTNKPKDTACTADALACTNDVCDNNGTCTHPVTTGCLIAGACVATGTQSTADACLECNPLTSTTAYSPKAKSSTCPGGCAVDGDCTALQYCQSTTFTCLIKLANGTAIPTLDGHLPVLNGTCTAEVAQSVCASGVCDATTSACGYAAGNGPCTATAQCASGVCITAGANNGKCLPCMTGANCDPSKPVCDTASNQCVTCGATNNSACTGTTPACNVAMKTCAACNGDYGTSATLACPMSAHPFCQTEGGCGSCTSNADCAGTGHPTPVCNTATGACGNGCAADTDCAGGFCQEGACQTKVTGDGPLPEGIVCTAEVGTRICESGTCDATDNNCGYAGGHACTGGTECRAGVCNTDMRCGAKSGEACQSNLQCRGGHCGPDGKCGLLGGDRCTSTADCRGGACLVADGRCGALPGTHCTAATDCRSGTCGADGLCGLADGATCTTGSQCRNGLCTAGLCASPCTAASSCGPGLYCGAGGHCILAAPTGASCTAAAQCAAGACGSDGKCGADIGGACAGGADCKSNICIAAKCAAACAQDADCGTGSLCVGTTCIPGKGRGAPCAADRDCASGICGNAGVCGASSGEDCPSPQSCTSGVCDATTNTCADHCAHDADCAIGTFCDSTGACIAAASVSSSSVCVRDANCASGVCGSDGQCGLVSGASCAASSQCRSGVCDASDDKCGVVSGGHCTASTGATICRSGVCGSDNTCGNSVGGPCTTGKDCTTGICDPDAHVCASCAADTGCSGATYCTAGSCQPKLADGTACTKASQCNSGACGSDGKCGKINGEACTTSAQCRQGACNSGHCGTVAYRVGGGGGCTMATGSESAGGGTVAIFLAAALGMALRRRRR